jgi:hypothetical protein
MSRNTQFRIQNIENNEPLIEGVFGITVPQINYGQAIGGAAAPENNATLGATWGSNLSSIPAIVASLVNGILGAWNVTNFNLRSGSSDAASDILLDPTNTLIRLGKTTGDYITLDGLNKRIRSSNYAAGVSGFNIDPILIEAENIKARGTLQGVTFSYDKISAIGGQLMVANADTLASDMTALDASTLTIKGETTFAVNDIILMRAIATSGIQEEWLRVTDISSAPIYVVTRDIKGDYTADNNPIWKAGTPVVKQGSSNGTDAYSGGWLRLIGEGTNAPYYSVFARDGVNYNDYAETCRLGNLNGFLDYVSDIYGIAIGNSDASLSYDIVNGLRLLGISRQFFTTVASDTLQTSADTFGSSSSAEYEKVKEIEYNDVDGTLRIKFDITTPSATSDTCYGRIYKNGVAYGTERSSNNDTPLYDTFSEDLTFETGDLIQLYVKKGSAGGCYYRNFRVYYTKAVTTEENTINID